MIFAKILRMRDKLTSKRQQLTEDTEKPFLEHLDDLRKMLMKITITMLITVIFTMFWYNEFFEIVKWPAKKAGLSVVEDRNRPIIFDYDNWEKLKATAKTIQSLNDAQRAAYFGPEVEPAPTEVPAVTPAPAAEAKPVPMRAYAEALLLYRAAYTLAPTVNARGEAMEPKPEELARQNDFITKAAGPNPSVLAALQEMIKARTKPDIEPAKPAIELVWRKPAESFFTAMKLALYAGVLLAFPLVFYFILEFVLPGLTNRERKLLWPALAIGFGLFLTGVVFAFMFVVPKTLSYFHNFGVGIEGTQDLWTVADYVSFVTVFSLVFGISFELPVVVLVLVKLGLMTSEFMRRTRSWAIIIILVVSAVITPTGDPVTLGSLCLPMILMYEACIWIAAGMERRAKAKEEAEEKEARERHAAYLLSLPPEERERVIAAANAPDTPPEPVLHPEITPYRHPHEDAYHDHDYHNDHYHQQHDPDHDHDAWLKEQQEIYRQEHAHLFAEDPVVDPTPEAPADPPAQEPEMVVPEENPGTTPESTPAPPLPQHPD